MIPKNLKYSKEHEWAQVDGDIATVGITQYAQEELGDIVFVELPEIGREVEQLEEFGVVESVKTMSSLFVPLSGKIVEVNRSILDEPERINEDPYGDGWLVKVQLSDPNEIDDLLSAEEYEQMLSAAKEEE